MAISNERLRELGPQDRQAVEAWLTEFDLGWTSDRLDEAVRLLPPAGDARRWPALIELVKIDLERQWQRGQRLRVESYLETYPELEGGEGVPADLLQKEFELRRQHGASGDREDLAPRFPDLATTMDPLPRSGTLPSAPEGATRSPLPEYFGRYHLLRRLGEGSMGTVYLAHDGQLDRQVALKVPRVTVEDKEGLARFQREARAAAALHHPNLCPVFDVGEIDGIHYLTMGYVEGRPLAALLLEGPLPAAQATALARTLALALAEAHRHGVVHRDLKPANVLLDSRGEPVVVDFGLARRRVPGEARLTKSGDVVGTPTYMSPEQARGNPDAIGPSSDIYSLGAVLYEMLTARPPFEGNLAEVFAAILADAPVPPSAIRPGLDPRLDAICLKAMAKNPEDRYRSMDEFAGVLADDLDQVGESPRTSKAGRQGQRVVLAVAAGVVALLVGLLLISRLPPPDGDSAKHSPPIEPEPPKDKVVHLGKHMGEVRTVGFHPKGRWGVSAGDDGAIRVWDVDLRVEVPRFKPRPGFAINAFAFSPDGVHLVSGDDDGRVRLWNFETGALVRTFKGSHDKWVKCVAFSSNGEHVVSGGEDQTVRVWAVANGEERCVLKGHGHKVYAVAFVSNDRLAVSCSEDQTIRQWRLEDAKEESRWHAGAAGASSLVVLPDGLRLLTGGYDNDLLLWEIGKQNSLARLQKHTSAVLCVAVYAGGRRGLSGDLEGALQVWDLVEGKALDCLEGHKGEVWSVAASPDGKVALSGGVDRLVRLWRLPPERADR